MNTTTLLAALPSASLASAARIPNDRNPALVYLASLDSKTSRATMRNALRRACSVFGYDGLVEDFAWHLLRYQHTTAMRAAIAPPKFSPGHANKIIVAVRRVLRCAYKLELLAELEYRRAVEDLTSVKGKRVQRGRYVERGELVALAQATSSGSGLDVRNRALLGILNGTAMRRDELASLELVHLDGRRMVVRGKGDREREIFLPSGSARAIEAWLELRGREPGPLLCGVRRGRGGTYILLRRRMRTQSVYDIIKRLTRRAKVRHFSPHDLRRTTISDLLDRTDVRTVQLIAGHANVNTTMGYDRRGARKLEEAAELLDVPFG